MTVLPSMQKNNNSQLTITSKGVLLPSWPFSQRISQVFGCPQNKRGVCEHNPRGAGCGRSDWKLRGYWEDLALLLPIAAKQCMPGKLAHVGLRLPRSLQGPYGR